MVLSRIACPLVVAFLIAGGMPSAADDVSSAENVADVSPCESQAIGEHDFLSAEFWSTLDGKPIGDSWEICDGEVRLTMPRGGKGSLLSPALPPNFELSFDWKIEKRANTGLKYRVRKFGGRYLGIEYQIIDDRSDLPGKGRTASIYDLVKPNESKTLNPPGEWNTARIVAKENLIEHYLNGNRVASTSIAGPEWDRAIALSKFYGEADFGQPVEGDRIMLTDHGGKAAYRNFQFVALDDNHEPKTAKLSPPFLGNAMRNSWADQDSIVIWTRTTAHPEMAVDGAKFISLSAGQAKTLALETDDEKILGAQIPSDETLEKMFGACPGAKGRVRLLYFPGKQRASVKSTRWIETAAESDFTAQWKLEGLKSGTRYAAIIEAQSVETGQTTAVVRGAFQTAPPKDATKDLKFCITTCHDFIRRDDGMNGHKIYSAMKKIGPNFVVHAGDIEYYDKPDPWAMTESLMRFKWGRIFSLPNNREFYAGTSSYFLKDDHDTLKNDCWAGQRFGSVTFERGIEIFNSEQFPSLSPRYTTVHWGKDLQIWFLEGRDYRSPNNVPDGPEKTILGEEQKAWLFQTLDDSTARFKIICSPTPVIGPDRKNKKDNHSNAVFAHEGKEIRDRLSQIENVIVLCGDRHWQYASHDQEANLWEFGCGPGSEKHQLGWKEGDERPLHQFLRVKGGFLSGQLRYKGDEKEAELTLRHHDVDGNKVSEFRFPIQ